MTIPSPQVKAPRIAGLPDFFSTPDGQPHSRSPRAGAVVARVYDGIETRTISLRGRFGWALRELVAAGERGVTPIDRPAPRWSHYVWRLRHEWGINIETLTEAHGGAFPGHHARYVLGSRVQILEDDAEPSRTVAA